MPRYERTRAEADLERQMDRRQLARKHGLILFVLGVVLPVLVYLCVVVFFPLNVLERLPGLKALSDSVRDALLTSNGRMDIYSHARSTEFPQVAMLASSLAVVLVVYITLAFTVQNLMHYEEIQNTRVRGRSRLRDAFAVVAILPVIMVFAFWIFFCMGGDPSSAAGLTTKNRVGYFLISVAVVLGAGVSFGTWIASFRVLCSAFWSQRSNS